MFYLVSYDIPDDKRRVKLAKTLKDFGDRVQYSVFECILDNAFLEKMKTRIADVINEAEDSVRIYGLCGACEKSIEILGQGTVSKEEDIYVI